LKAEDTAAKSSVGTILNFENGEYFCGAPKANGCKLRKNKQLLEQHGNEIIILRVAETPRSYRPEIQWFCVVERAARMIC
jgi:hypothetical protein